MSQPTIAQDVASIIARQVTERLEDVEGMGILSASDRKAMDEYVHSQFLHDDNRTNYYIVNPFYYKLTGDEFKNPCIYRSDGRCDGPYFIMMFQTRKDTRRVKKQLVTTWTYEIDLDMKKAGTIHRTDISGVKHVANEKISIEVAVELFEKMLSIMRTTGKCDKCEKYKPNIIRFKDGVGTCPACYMHARVKRARNF